MLNHPGGGSGSAAGELGLAGNGLLVGPDPPPWGPFRLDHPPGEPTCCVGVSFGGGGIKAGGKGLIGNAKNGILERKCKDPGDAQTFQNKQSWTKSNGNIPVFTLANKPA